MLTLPLVLFAVAAVGGLVMAIPRFGGKPLPPFAIAIIHGVVAAAGLVTLILVVAGGGAPSAATIALVLFLVAALGGFALFFQHLKKQPISIPLMVIHALVAVAGFLTLLVTALG